MVLALEPVDEGLRHDICPGRTGVRVVVREQRWVDFAVSQVLVCDRHVLHRINFVQPTIVGSLGRGGHSRRSGQSTSHRGRCSSRPRTASTARSGSLRVTRCARRSRRRRSVSSRRRRECHRRRARLGPSASHRPQRSARPRLCRLRA